MRILINFVLSVNSEHIFRFQPSHFWQLIRSGHFCHYSATGIDPELRRAEDRLCGFDSCNEVVPQNGLKCSKCCRFYHRRCNRTRPRSAIDWICGYCSKGGLRVDYMKKRLAFCLIEKLCTVHWKQRRPILEDKFQKFAL